MAQTLTTGEFIHRRLRPMRSRLRLRDTLWLASRTLWIGLAGFALVQGAGWLLPIPNLLRWSLVPPALWALAVLGYLLLRPLPHRRVAQRVDAELGLRERLSTALELSGQAQPHPLDELQQADARGFAETLRPRMLPLRIDRQPLLWALAPLAAGLALALLPNPQDAALRDRAVVQQALQQTADQTQQLRQQIAQDQTLTPEDRAALDQQLADLERKLRENGGSREQALADLSTIESQLQQRVDPNADARRAALENMARNLQSLSGRQPSQRPSLDQAAQQLQQLAQQLDQMTPEQRQQAAQQLQQQAGQLAQSNPQLAQNLSNAAQALQQGNNQQAQQSLQQAAQQAQQAQQQQNQQQALQRALAQVQQGRQNIAQAGQQNQQGQQQQGQQNQQNQQGQQQQGQQGQQQQGQQNQQGQGQGQGQQGQGQQGQQGQGQGAQGQGGQGPRDLNNSQGQGGQSSQGSPNNQGSPGSGQGEGHSDKIYQPYDPANPQAQPDSIQGQQGQGGETQVQQGQANLPGVSGPALVPYEQQLPRYERAAGEALDQSAIPPHLKDYVRDYFSNLEPKR